MFKVILIILMLIHGLIHLMGFAKAYNYSEFSQLNKEISKPLGIVWLLTTLLFIITILLLFFNINYWIVSGIIAVLFSQVLIFLVWNDAKFGSIANIIILVAIILNMGSLFFERGFKADVNENLGKMHLLKKEMLTEADILVLPQPIQRYLRYANVINKPKVKNVRIEFEGQMREKGKEFFKFKSVQYNFFDDAARLFFMKGKMFGISIPGYHRYVNATASMDIRLFGLYSVVKKEGAVMNKTETVTLFNDMCLMAPATLIDKRIKWEEIDSNAVKAFFTNEGITISSILYFNEKGQLVNFVSNDRTEINTMKQYPFWTPVSNYKNINGVNIMTKGETVYEYPDGKFTYGIFNLKNIEYNIE